MYVPFDELAPSSRVWVYTSSRPLESGEINLINSKLTAFCQQWTSHQKDVLSSFLVLHNRFIILAADDSYSDVSGCGIDKSLHALQELENDLSLSLTNKTMLIFEKGGNLIEQSLPKAKEGIATGTVNETDHYFNTLVSTIQQYKTEFKIFIKDSWLKKYLPVKV